MRPSALLSTLLGLLPATTVAAQGADPPRIETVYTVKQQGGGLGIFVDQTVVIQSVSRRGETVWVVERRERRQNVGRKTQLHQWIDGRRCAPLKDVLAGIARLPPVQFERADRRDRGWVSDTPYVTLTGPLANGRAGETLARVDLAGPVSRWWRDSEARLAACWRDGPVSVGDAAVPAKLATDEDAAAAGRLVTNP